MGILARYSQTIASSTMWRDIIFPTWTLPLLFVLLATAYLVYNKYGYSISAIPGPFLASYTHLWRLFLVWKRRPEVTHIDLHEKYGLLVRLGPNAVSVSDPEAIKVIYGLGSKYLKVRWCSSFCQIEYLC